MALIYYYSIKCQLEEAAGWRQSTFPLVDCVQEMECSSNRDPTCTRNVALDLNPVGIMILILKRFAF